MNATEKKRLKTDAHRLKPVVIVGQSGLTPAVMAEIVLALDCHELVKIKLRADREQRSQMTSAICLHSGAELIDAIGQVAVIYRVNPKKRAAATH